MRSLCVLIWTIVSLTTHYPCVGFVNPTTSNHLWVQDSGSKLGRSPPTFPNQGYHAEQRHSALMRQRRSLANVQAMGLFGLGGPEIAIIAIAAAFLIGPQKLGEMAGGLTAQLDDLEDLKKIPEEFQKGVEEGEANARARNAKEMERMPPEVDNEKKDS